MAKDKSDRTWVTWAVGLASCLMAASGLINHLGLIAGARGAFGNREQFVSLTASWSTVTWLVTPVLGVVLLAAGVLLLRLNRNAVPAYGIYVVGSAAATLYHALTSDWLQTFGLVAVAASVCSLALFLGFWLYARSLKAEGRLA